jgi:hypothetical protein
MIAPLQHPIGQLDRPKCGCPFRELEHRGITFSIHADPGEPISAYVYDMDTARYMTAPTMEGAGTEARRWIDTLLNEHHGEQS